MSEKNSVISAVSAHSHTITANGSFKDHIAKFLGDFDGDHYADGALVVISSPGQLKTGAITVLNPVVVTPGQLKLNERISERIPYIYLQYDVLQFLNKAANKTYGKVISIAKSYVDIHKIARSINAPVDRLKWSYED